MAKIKSHPLYWIALAQLLAVLVLAWAMREIVIPVVSDKTDPEPPAWRVLVQKPKIWRYISVTPDSMMWTDGSGLYSDRYFMDHIMPSCVYDTIITGKPNLPKEDADDPTIDGDGCGHF